MRFLLLETSSAFKIARYVSKYGMGPFLLNTYLNSFSTSPKVFLEPKEVKRGFTPAGKLDESTSESIQNKADPYAPFPDNKNPDTGEVGGPRGPEPTRYGDWERKGRVSDF